MHSIGVVIPFYQRDKGILLKSLKSIIEQESLSKITYYVVIVDDCSPLSLSEELALLPTLPKNIHLISLYHKTNSGPAIARNTALKYIQTKLCNIVDYVAFLDSDDQWGVSHSTLALEAFDLGASFYFGNTDRDGFYDSNWNTDIPEMERDLSHFLVGESKFLIDSPVIIQSMYNKYLSQTSTVMYRLSKFPEVLFCDQLRFAGEDELMWLLLCSNADKVAYYPCDITKCGKGVNMFFSNISWDLVGSCNIMGSKALATAMILENIPLDSEQRKILKKTFNSHCYVYFKLMVKHMLKFRDIDFKNTLLLVKYLVSKDLSSLGEHINVEVELSTK
ncbi:MULTISPECIES: glycosyltransferase family 2 protein [Pseudoalteromonas]|mgnify:FL=1|uniref:glycosyltransferase family 2 protein n=1 Tax=Pseudoalteromonas TaxID=53246 RepID=UPI00249CF044|nr:MULTISPECIES: glycosyltransferase family 2 protein [Pseudoalteromonas]MDI3246165.1 glycosyltransferase family 2 protein [Pseudoalteromonas agarivorans]WRU74859.1 glycosyltransferase family 2 protein [Pseudoalteromonas sp. CuT 4-3]